MKVKLQDINKVAADRQQWVARRDLLETMLKVGPTGSQINIAGPQGGFMQPPLAIDETSTIDFLTAAIADCGREIKSHDKKLAEFGIAV